MLSSRFVGRPLGGVDADRCILGSSDNILCEGEAIGDVIGAVCGQFCCTGSAWCSALCSLTSEEGFGDVVEAMAVGGRERMGGPGFDDVEANDDDAWAVRAGNPASDDCTSVDNVEDDAELE